jgi:hypothetical protein
MLDMFCLYGNFGTKIIKIGATAKKSLMFECSRTKLLKSNNISDLFINT